MHIRFSPLQAILVLAVLAGCRQQATKPSSDPRALVRQHLGFPLPDSARNVRCESVALMVYWVYVGFELPAEDMDLFLAASDRLPAFADFRTDASCVSDLQDCGEMPWWQPSQLAVPLCATKEGTAKGRDGKSWRWRTTVAADGEAMLTVYLVYFEEPWRDD